MVGCAAAAAVAVAAVVVAVAARCLRQRSVVELSTFVDGTVSPVSTRIGFGLALIEVGTRSDTS
eukprot:COSAG02_NODE_1195_length_13940_cov_15.482407_6_plen_64_part_00